MPDLQAEEVLSHHKAVFEADIQAIRDRQARILKQLEACGGASYVVRRALRLNSPQILTSNLKWPRVSHRIYGAVFNDLRMHNQKILTNALDFISETAVPLSGVSYPQLPARTSVYTNNKDDFCPDTEVHFVNMLNQLEGGPFTQPRLSVFHDKDGLPLAIRKTYESQIALTLTNFTVTGSKSRVRTATNGETHIPAGTYVVVEDDSSIKPSSPVRRENKILCLETYEAGPGFAVHPLKLSPWIHGDRLDRATFATGIVLLTDAFNSYDEKRGNLLAGRSLQDFISCAGRIMTASGLAVV